MQRDVRDLTKVGDEKSFLKFLRATAARTGKLVNYAIWQEMLIFLQTQQKPGFNFRNFRVNLLT